MPIYQWVGRDGRWGRCLYGLLRLSSDHYIVAKLGWYPAELRSNEPVLWPAEWSAHSQWVGRLHIPERRLSLFKANQTAGIEVESIDFESLKRFWSVRDLFPAVLELEHQSKGCETLLPSNDAIYKHRSYQYQWYGIAILIGVLYGYYGFRRSAEKTFIFRCNVVNFGCLYRSSVIFYAYLVDGVGA
jgi:cytochrome oxidase assembly protein ShyY1